MATISSIPAIKFAKKSGTFYSCRQGKRRQPCHDRRAGAMNVRRHPRKGGASPRRDSATESIKGFWLCDRFLRIRVMVAASVKDRIVDSPRPRFLPLPRKREEGPVRKKGPGGYLTRSFERIVSFGKMVRTINVFQSKSCQNRTAMLTGAYVQSRYFSTGRLLPHSSGGSRIRPTEIGLSRFRAGTSVAKGTFAKARWKLLGSGSHWMSTRTRFWIIQSEKTGFSRLATCGEESTFDIVGNS